MTTARNITTNERAPLSDKERGALWRPVEECVCPRCKGSASRIKRRPIDLLTGMFQDTQRFRCRSIGCSWRGNISIKPQDAELVGWV